MRCFRLYSNIILILLNQILLETISNITILIFLILFNFPPYNLKIIIEVLANTRNFEIVLRTFFYISRTISTFYTLLHWSYNGYIITWIGGLPFTHPENLQWMYFCQWISISLARYFDCINDNKIDSPGKLSSRTLFMLLIIQLWLTKGHLLDVCLFICRNRKVFRHHFTHCFDFSGMLSVRLK